MNKYSVQKVIHLWVEVDADDPHEARQGVDNMSILRLAELGNYSVDYTEIGSVVLIDADEPADSGGHE